MSSYESHLFDIETVPLGERYIETLSDQEYLYRITPVVEAFGIQVGETDRQTKGYFKIKAKDNSKAFLERTYGRSDDSFISIATRGNPYDSIYESFDNFLLTKTSSRIDFEGFISGINKDSSSNKYYAVLYSDCTDVATTMVCIDLLDISEISKYSDNAETVMAMAQNAFIDGDTTMYPPALREGWSMLSAETMRYIIDNHWPDPELIYTAPRELPETQ